MVRSAVPVLALLAVSAGAGLAQSEVRAQFADVAAEAGIVLRNVSGGSAEKWTILESTGAGACFLDHDGDGDLDLYLANGATLATLGRDNPAHDALYENDGRSRFTDVTVRAGLGDDRWGGGCAVSDYDNDGDSDLYVTNFGPDVLYRNEGDGTFRDVTGIAGLGDPRWGLGAVFVDFDRDGDLDLYVANYLRFDPTDPKVLAARCRWKGGEVMCGPRGFEGEADVLYRNNGDGTFTDISTAARVGGDALYGMGAVAGDLEGDGDPDLFVANDSQENLLWVNDGTGRFADQALPAGVALSGDGRAQAGMGADLGDYDGDGDEDLFVTNFSDDYHTLYRNEGDLLFTDVSAAAGLDPVTRPSLGWGGGFFDFDNDGDLDLFVASGHVYPGVERFDPATSYRQRNLLLENNGRGRFSEVSKISGPGFAMLRGSRGAAFGDWDDDGDLDVVVVNADEAPTLLRNDGGNARPWIKLRLIGRRSNRDGLGARLRLTAGGRTQFREVRRTGGYCSSHDPRVHFGLGAATAVERLEVRWPSGREQVVSDLPAGHLVTLDEERGVISVLPLARRTDPGSQLPSLQAPAAEPAMRPAGLPEPAVAPRLTPEDLRRLDSLVQEGTRRILAGQYSAGIGAYERALARLPAWEQAATSSDALGFGERERYRSFLAALHDNLGVGLMRAERLEECAEAIGKALAIQPGRAKFHHNLGLCHYHAHRYGEAVAAFEAAAGASDPPAALRYDLGRTLAAAGRCGEAEAALAAAIAELPRPDLRGRDAEAWYHLGSCLADRGRLPEAVDALREALARVPGHQKALYKLALALRRSGRQSAAERAQALFAARQPADEIVRSLKRAGARDREERLRLIRAYRDIGLAPQAVQEAQMALAADPRDARAAALLGQSLLALHPPALDPAEQAFRRALELDLRQPEALAGLGEALRRAGRLGEAAQWFERALAAERPNDLTAAVGLARVVAASGEVDSAVARLEGLRARWPEDPGLLRALAEVYVMAPPGPLRRPAEALTLLDRAGELYGERLDTRLRALALLSKGEEFQRLLAESPFLGQAERAALARLAAGE